jgi:hypothetical protein
MKSFTDSLVELYRENWWYFFPGIIVLGIMIGLIALGISIFMSFMNSNFNSLYLFIALVVLFFIITVIFQIKCKDESENENLIILGAKIAGVSLIIALVISVILILMGSIFNSFGYIGPLIVYFIIAIIFYWGLAYISNSSNR